MTIPFPHIPTSLLSWRRIGHLQFAGNFFSRSKMTSSITQSQSKGKEIRDFDAEFGDEEANSFDQAIAQLSETEWSRICSDTQKQNTTENSNKTIQVNEFQKNQYPIDLTLSPEELENAKSSQSPKKPQSNTIGSNSRRPFGLNLTNSTLLADIDRICSANSLQSRTFATVAPVYPPLPVTSKAKTIPPTASSSKFNKPPPSKPATSKGRPLALSKQAREWETQKLERNLVAYTYKRPAGKIGKMRRTVEEMESERVDLQISIFQGKANAPRIAVSNVHIPNLHICTTIEESEKRLENIQSGEVLSYDMEWVFNRTSYNRHKTSVVQLASATDIYILQVSLMKSIPKQLIRVLGDPTILKCGVAVKQDAAKFRADFDHQVNGCIELSVLARRADPERWENGGGRMIALRDLCRIYLNRKLDKDQGVRGSDWSKGILDDEQYHYAANDAYVGLEIMHSLAGLIIQSDPLKETSIFEHDQVKKILCEMGGIRTKTQDDLTEGQEKGRSKIASEKESVKNTKLFSVKSSFPNLEDDGFEFEAIAEDRANAIKRPQSSPISSPQSSKRVSARAVRKNLPVSKFMKKLSPPQNEEVISKMASPTSPTSPPSPPRASKSQKYNTAAVYLTKKDMQKVAREFLQLWQKGLNFDQIGNQLDSPPLKPSTIANYILWFMKYKQISLNEKEKQRLREGLDGLQPQFSDYAKIVHHDFLKTENIYPDLVKDK